LSAPRLSAAGNGSSRMVWLELELVEERRFRKVRSVSGTPSAADRREGVQRHPPTVAPARCKQLYESVGKSLPEAKSEKLMTSRKPVCS
jgi:hypothetical protein